MSLFLLYNRWVLVEMLCNAFKMTKIFLSTVLSGFKTLTGLSGKNNLYSG
jgi:hypothetical protein